ncbi:hypothetical protein F2Q70_00026852 [Brassica cretica]|uniref:Uncharacterized protein n=1 Tax=Brassica cretica TaxID=69181 RepID=A0A8S9IG53_BRACR|nr:hypothetical protein F2Q68_00026414 [Brassica cretica]KAF2604829.1 hypothetical protein F2Q70_00026852 [Brassica cretica]
MTLEEQPHRNHHENSKVHGKLGEMITSPTQAAKALQAKVLGNVRSGLLSAATIFFDPQRRSGLLNTEGKRGITGTVTTITIKQLGFS